MQGPETRAPAVGRVLSIRELASGLRDLVERQFDDVWVEGEITNFKRPTSGHCYFTLKDDHAQVRCVLWRSSARYVSFTPADGMHVRVRGQVTLYEARGDLQLVARALHPAGDGALRQAFEALKQKLLAEGLFDPCHKKPIPRMPAHIGIVTSGDGAALQDMLTVLRRRYPVVRVTYVPVRVQGMVAADEIAAAVACFGRREGALRPDVLIVGRGGGSVEDLWAFNEEVVARAIFQSEIPIVSAVGHETDFSISDLVADQRAATPTMAAELVSPDQQEIGRRIRLLVGAMRAGVVARIVRERQMVINVIRSYVFNRPLDQLRHHQRHLDDLHERLRGGTMRVVNRHRQARESLTRRLLLLDPRRPLEQGYVSVEKDGKRIPRAGGLVKGERLALQFADGTLDARVEHEVVPREDHRLDEEFKIETVLR